MADDIESWFDALAGAGEPPAPDRRLMQALRRAARGLDTAPVDELALQRLKRRLAAEGLLGEPRAPALGRHLARAAVVLLCVGVTLEWAVFSPRDVHTVPPAPSVAEPREAGAARLGADADSSGLDSRRDEAEGAPADRPEAQLEAPPSQAFEALGDSEPRRERAPGSPAPAARSEPESAKLRSGLGDRVMSMHRSEARRGQGPALDLSAEQADELLSRLREPSMAKAGIRVDRDNARRWRIRCLTAQACERLGAMLDALDYEVAEPIDGLLWLRIVDEP